MSESTLPALQISSLRKTYQGGFEALKGIDLTVEEGDFFALLGPNGAGKSTTIGIIASLVNKTSGKVQILDKDLDTNRAGAKHYLGLVPQEFNFNQFEPVEEILINQAGYYGISRHKARQRANRYLKQLDLWDKRRAESRQLSGGMKRRMMIARALVHEPRILILDEPTAGVDIEIRRSMWEFLSEINANGTTIILTTHYLEEAENLCRNIAIIDQGKIIKNSSMKALLNELACETLMLDLKEPLTEAPRISGFELTLKDPLTIEVEVAKETGLNLIFCQLQDQGIIVTSMRNKSNRLEALFMGLVNNGSNGKAA
ncbi:MAG TPA: ABC transporter ATP-binding protein [Gammaproteobacteria bacterium]|nr:ABC transporter ATP-binding protein [Gammaproteobacteria bacterium]